VQGSRAGLPDARSWGVATRYIDGYGRRRRAPAATIRAVLQAMDARADQGEGAHGDEQVPLIVRQDDGGSPLGRGTLITEDGGELETDGRSPAALPLGYHRWLPGDGLDSIRPLIVSPGRCPLPGGDGRWGFATQLYATRSAGSWGMGDLADLRELGRWSGGLGARFLMVNPLHAASVSPRQQPSPYFPSSRCFMNPLYLRVDEVAGAGVPSDASRLLADARAETTGLNRAPILDRDRIWSVKAPVLEACFARFGGSRDFERFWQRGGDALAGFCAFAALTEHHGAPWQSWPAEVRHPRAGGVARFSRTREGRRRIRYHAWMQWQLDRQLAAASNDIGLVHDLAVGVDPGGADAWRWQDAFALGMRVGAPPDEFSAGGQNWGLPPWDPWRLRRLGYQPFIETVRAGFRHAAGLRVDHVMGLFRLFWIPEGRPPGEGTYVAYPSGDLLDILALEAHRAGAYVVGEDLGTVQRQVRAELARRRVLSYRLLWFDERPPSSWPAAAMGAVTTHDLPTVAGVLSGEDLAEQERCGLHPNADAMAHLGRRLQNRGGLGGTASAADAIRGAYGTLAEAPCKLLAATLEDVCQVTRRPNLPGTLEERPNWNLALPVPLEELEDLPLAAELANLLRRGAPRVRGGSGFSF
jgi:4-alpha-glucanotransferase